MQNRYKNIDQWDNSSWFVLGFNIQRFGRLIDIADWSIENMNRDVHDLIQDVVRCYLSPKKIIIIRATQSVVYPLA